MPSPQPNASSKMAVGNRPKTQPFELTKGKQNTIFRSQQSTNVYDMSSNTVADRAKTPGTPANGQEFAKRFKTMQTKPARKVGLDSKQITPRDPQFARNLEGFFPSVKLSQSPTRLATAASFGGENNIYETNKGFEISPSPEMTAQYYLPKSAREPIQHTKSVELNDICARRYPYFTQTFPNLIIKTETSIIGGDLSLLPRPKNFVARRNLPWVYRYKYKKNMNQLSQIMASKPPKIAAVD